MKLVGKTAKASDSALRAALKMQSEVAVFTPSAATW